MLRCVGAGPREPVRAQAASRGLDAAASNRESRQTTGELRPRETESAGTPGRPRRTAPERETGRTVSHVAVPEPNLPVLQGRGISNVIDRVGLDSTSRGWPATPVRTFEKHTPSSGSPKTGTASPWRSAATTASRHTGRRWSRAVTARRAASGGNWTCRSPTNCCTAFSGSR